MCVCVHARACVHVWCVDDSDSLSTSEVSSSLLSDNKSASDVTTDSPMVLEEISVGLVGDLDATPVPEDVVDGGKVIKFSGDT